MTTLHSDAIQNLSLGGRKIVQGHQKGGEERRWLCGVSGGVVTTWVEGGRDTRGGGERMN